MLALDRRAEADAPSRIAEPHRQEEGSDEHRRLLCHRCRHPITDADQRVDIAGCHRHARMNPHGLSFVFGCFRAAAGCRLFGSAYVEHSWFSGYSWQIALCAHCGAHLGWHYRGSEPSFFGLILANLVVEEG